MTPHIGRARTGAWYLLTAAACAVLVTACGSSAATGGAAAGGTAPAGTASGGPASNGTASPGPSSGGSGGAGQSGPAKVSLDIQVSHGPGTAIRRWTLRCEPAGGTHPDPAAACRALLHAKNPFGPLPKGIMCPMIVQGAEVAKVRGSYLGRPVNITMEKGGCWLARWNEFGQKIFN
ncbi:MAG TPA: SSI family serine proteinase inhibitor [Streptosporangiaceae bacterium]|jgi:hypothetical protein